MVLVWLAAALSPLQVSAQTADETPAVVVDTDPYGRATPRGTVEGYLSAIRESDLEKAALFLDVRGLPDADGLERTIELRDLLDNGGLFFSLEDISAQPEGDLSDEMSADLEIVGTLGVGGRDVDLILQRIPAADDTFVWLFSHDTVAQLPELHRYSTEGILDQFLPDTLKTTRVFSVPIGHWLAILATAAVAFLIGQVAANRVLKGLLWMLPNRWSAVSGTDARNVRYPLGVLIAVMLYRSLVVAIGVQVVARGSIDWVFSTLYWGALALLCLRIVDLVAEMLASAVERETHRKSLAALILTRKIAKAVIVTVLAVQLLEILGFDVTTAIAALGIGGLALALGAQRTVENLVGSVIVVADRPVEVGDFCKFGDVSGTVEDIGIRSTQIRTAQRTIISVPNGAFASMQIENFSVRDRFFFHRVLSLRNDVSPEQVRAVITRIRDFMDAAGFISEDSRVNLVDLTRWSIEVEVLCYVEAPDFAEFVKLRERFVFSLLDSVNEEYRFIVSPDQSIIA